LTAPDVEHCCDASSAKAAHNSACVP
jgi:hypothetical protein